MFRFHLLVAFTFLALIYEPTLGANEVANVAGINTGSTHAPVVLLPVASPPKKNSNELPTIIGPAVHNKPPTSLKPANHVTSNLVLSHMPTTAAPLTPITNVVIQAKPVATAPQAATTAGPKVVVTVKPTGVATVFESKSMNKTAVIAQPNVQLTKFNEYLKPLCESIEKLQPKQMFKIQTQFKQFVQLTNGKLGICFLEHYLFDPTLKLVGKPDLTILCNSRNLQSELKGSYQSFQNCASKNWDPAVDKELDKVIAARLNCAKNHKHGKNETTTAVVPHDDDEMSIISEVVSQVLDGDKILANNSDVKIIDITGTAKPSTVTPLAEGSDKNSTKASKAAKVSGILNDPNTVVVFMDDSNRKTTTLAPKSIHVVTKVEVETPKPTVTNAVVEIEKSTSSKPLLTQKLLLAEQSTPTPSTTTKPAEQIATSSTPSPPISDKIEVSVEQSKASDQTSTTEAPATAIAVTASSDKMKVDVSSVKTTTTTTEKPAESVESLLKRHEKERQELELKLKLDKSSKQGHKKQEGLNALKAMRSLQMQRDASAHGSDARLHQIEHERQMAINPIGHSLKHQQYEISKQKASISRSRMSRSAGLHD